jgi:hypothetical protein
MWPRDSSQRVTKHLINCGGDSMIIIKEMLGNSSLVDSQFAKILAQATKEGKEIRTILFYHVKQ